MNRVATFNGMQTATSEFLRAQMKQFEAQQQMSTGRKAHDLKGFGRDADTITAARTVKARVDSFVSNSKTLASRLETQNLSLERLADVAAKVREAVANAVASGRAGTLMAELNSWMSQAAETMNMKHGGRYMFAGSATDAKPVVVDNLADLAALPTVGDAFANDQAPPVSRLDESTTAVSGFLADAVGEELFTVLRDFQVFHTGAGGPLSDELTPAQQAFLEGKLVELDAAHGGLIQRVAENGLLQQRVEDAQEAQEARAISLEAFLGDLTDVDMAETIGRLQQAQAALQASAYAMKTLQSISLMNFLTPSSS